MTPLAQRYFGQLMLKKSDRALDPHGALRFYEDLHCFEVSAIRNPISDSIDGHTFSQTLLALPGPHLLPAPATWIEFDAYDDGERLAWFVVELDDGWGMFSVNKTLVATPIIGAVPPVEEGEEWRFFSDHRPVVSSDMALSMFTEALMIIDVLVTPSLIVKVPHDPHAGFARRFRNMPGGYPLHAWHEVTINPDAVRVVTDADGKLCGRKCMHFVHGFRRTLAPGRQVPVRAHWRGDPAIGMMRTKYRAAPVRRAVRKLAKAKRSFKPASHANRGPGK